MNLVIHPAVEVERLETIRAAVGPGTVINASSEDKAERAMPDADAFFGKITPRLLAAAGRLRWVQAATVSLERYIFPELVAHSCVLTNMRGLFSDAIADQVMGYILCFAHNLHRYLRNQVEHHWAPVGGLQPGSLFSAGPSTVTALDRAVIHLPDTTLGIVGLGSIGREVARRGRVFGMRAIAVDPVTQAKPEEVEALWRPRRLDDLLGASDFVVIAAPHTPETVKLFDRARIGRMKRTAYLINIGRGAIVDLDGLTAALRDHALAGAALDVFEIEPLPPESPLWDMENVIVTPHVAGFSPKIAERHLGVLLDNIGRFRRGEALRNLADKQKWY